MGRGFGYSVYMKHHAGGIEDDEVKDERRVAETGPVGEARKPSANDSL